MIRPEQTGDESGIRRVHEAAFPTPAEGRLVDALREAGKLVVSLVALDGAEVVGHIAFSPVRLEGAPDVGTGLGLAPVAVLPARQRQGIGGRLIRAGLAECERLGYQFVIVLGHPEYYPRFGFVLASRWGLGNEYGATEAFLAQELRAGAIPPGAGLVRYAEEFAEFGE